MQLTKSLYNIRQDQLILLTQVSDNEGELTDELENALSITREEFENKAVSLGYVLKSFDNSIELIDQEIKRLTELKKRASNRQGMIKERLSNAMNEFGIEKLNTATLSLSFRKSESVEIEDERLIPTDFTESKVVTTISKTKIKEAIKRGENVQGAKLVSNKNLQIK